MKSVVYYHNGVENAEELHEDEAVDQLEQGKVIERAGGYWRVVEIKSVTTVSAPKEPDALKVFLEGPIPQ
jgi:hypothetical protein